MSDSMIVSEERDDNVVAYSVKTARGPEQAAIKQLIKIVGNIDMDYRLIAGHIAYAQKPVVRKALFKLVAWIVRGMAEAGDYATGNEKDFNELSWSISMYELLKQRGYNWEEE